MFTEVVKAEYVGGWLYLILSNYIGNSLAYLIYPSYIYRRIINTYRQ